MKRFSTSVLSSAACLLLGQTLAGPAQAYVLSTSSNGQVLRWGASASPTFYTNWTNSSGLSYSQIFTSLTNSLQRWKAAGSGSVDFTYWQGNNSGTPKTWGYDGRNAIFFSSNSTQKLGSGTLGVTYTFSSGGVVLETDIEFNDEYVVYTTNPTHNSNSGDGIHVFLENVATHEIGHAYGLGHSAVLQSSMMFVEDRAQAKPSCDDIEGISVLYPLTSFTSGRGIISGTVMTGGTPIFGAQVHAISKTRGTTVSAAISYSSGQYSISNLEPGDYYLFVEPFQTTAPISSLCGGSASGCFFGSVNSSTVCSSGTVPFKRGFVESSSGVPATISVTADAVTTVPTYNISCSAMSGGTPATTTGTAPTLFANNAGVATGAARVMVMGAAGTTHYYKLSNVDGTISAKVLSYSLYSPFNPSVAILDSTGTLIGSASVSDNVFTNASGYTNYDAALTYAAPLDTYYIRVTNSGNLATSPGVYPAGGVTSQIDSTRYYLLIVTINDQTTLLPSSASPTMASNARCESTDSFGPYPDNGVPSELVPLASQSSSTSSGGGSKKGGCGAIYNFGENEGDSGGHGPGASAVFSIWGIVLMLVLSRVTYKLVVKPQGSL